MEPWLLVLVGTLVASVAMLAAVVAAILRLRAPRSGSAGPSASSTPPRSSLAVPLTRGFGYLGSPLSEYRCRAGVNARLERVFDRVAMVDPYLAPRRVGMALLQAGLVNDTGTTAAEAPVQRREPDSDDSPRARSQP